MSRIRVVIADDDISIREALATSWTPIGGSRVVGWPPLPAGSCAPLARAVAPDVVLLDVRMPGGGAAARAVHAARGRLRRRAPPARGGRGLRPHRTANVVRDAARRRRRLPRQGAARRAARPGGALRRRRGRAGRARRGRGAAPAHPGRPRRRSPRPPLKQRPAPRALWHPSRMTEPASETRRRPPRPARARPGDGAAPGDRAVQPAGVRRHQHGRPGPRARPHQVGDLPPRAEQDAPAAAGARRGARRARPRSSTAAEHATTPASAVRAAAAARSRSSVEVLVDHQPAVTLLLRVRGNSEVELAALRRRRDLDARLAAPGAGRGRRGRRCATTSPPTWSAGCSSAWSTRWSSGTAPAARSTPRPSPTRHHHDRVRRAARGLRAAR